MDILKVFEDTLLYSPYLLPHPKFYYFKMIAIFNKHPYNLNAFNFCLPSEYKVDITEGQ